MRWLRAAGAVLLATAVVAQDPGRGQDSDRREGAEDSAPEEWTENLLTFETLRLERAHPRQQIEITIHRWGEADGPQDFVVSVERAPVFVRKALLDKGGKVRFEPEESGKKLALLLVLGEPGPAEGELVLVIRAEDETLSPGERRYVLPLTLESSGIYWIAPFQVLGKNGAEPAPEPQEGLPEPRLFNVDRRLAEECRGMVSEQGEEEIAGDLRRLVRMFPNIAGPYGGAHVLRVCCENEVRYLCWLDSETRWGNTWPFRLAPGRTYVADILAVTEGEEVFRATVSFRVPKGHGDRGQSTREAQARLEEARAEPDPDKRRRYLSRALGDYIGGIFNLRLLAPPSASLVALVREYMRLRLDEITRDEERGRKREGARLKVARSTVSMCLRIGSMEALVLARQALGLAEGYARREDRSELWTLAGLYSEMAALAISAGFRVEEARHHAEDALAIRVHLRDSREAGESAGQYAVDPERERQRWPRRFGPYREGGALYDETTDEEARGER